MVKDSAFLHFQQTYPNIIMSHCDGLGMGPMIYKLVLSSNDLSFDNASRTLRKHERNYGISELETLAVVWDNAQLWNTRILDIREWTFSFQKKLSERNLINEVWFEKLQLFFMFQHYINPSVVSRSVCAAQEFRDYDTAQLLIQTDTLHLKLIGIRFRTLICRYLSSTPVNKHAQAVTNSNKIGTSLNTNTSDTYVCSIVNGKKIRCVPVVRGVLPSYNDWPGRSDWPFGAMSVNHL